MSTLRKRLADIEERQAFRDWQEGERQFDGRSADELQFFVLHGYWPENASRELPPNREYVVCGIRTMIVNEWEDKR
jgi:ribonuclease I